MYDQFGNLLSEATDTGITLREYIYLDNLPVAVVDLTGPMQSIYYIHSDHLGTPQLLTDENQRVVWEAEYAPFGEAHIDADPDRLAGSSRRCR